VAASREAQAAELAAQAAMTSLLEVDLRVFDAAVRAQQLLTIIEQSIVRYSAAVSSVTMAYAAGLPETLRG